MADLTSLYDQLREADRLAQQGDAQAQADAQKIYNHIQSLQSGKKETEESTEEIPIVTGGLGAGTGALLQFGSRIGPAARFIKNLPQTQKDLSTVAEVLRTTQNAQPAPQRTPAERMMQGTIDPETGATGRARQTSYNAMTSEQAAMRQAQLNAIEQLKKQGIITGQNPIIQGHGFQTATPTGVLAPPSAINAPPSTPQAPTQPPNTFASAVDRAKQMSAGAVNLANRLPGAGAARLAGPIAGGFGAGFGGAETYNRYYNQNDPVGAAISAVETGAGLASMYPPLAPIGLPVSYGAMALNMLRDKYSKKPEAKSVLEKADGGLVGGLSSLSQPSALTAQMAQQTPPNLGLPPVHSLDMMSSPNSSGSRPFPDQYNPNMRYAPPFKEGGSTTPAWQRKEGKSPSGGLNAVGRASYKRETGGELKAPQPEGGSRKKSFCARMGGMKKKLTSSKTANDPDSRINKALRKWKC